MALRREKSSVWRIRGGEVLGSCRGPKRDRVCRGGLFGGHTVLDLLVDAMERDKPFFACPQPPRRGWL